MIEISLNVPQNGKSIFWSGLLADDQDEAFQMSREAHDCVISLKLENWFGTGQALLKQTISMMRELPVRH